MGCLIVPRLASGLINAVHVLQAVVDTQRQFTRKQSLPSRATCGRSSSRWSQLQRAAGQYPSRCRMPNSRPRPADAALTNCNPRLRQLDERLADAAFTHHAGPLANAPAAPCTANCNPARSRQRRGSMRSTPHSDALHAAARKPARSGRAAVQNELQTLEATVQATRHG